ncbi:MAG TPA: helix-turn-helix transcriptional regulator [bacterium]|jgi:DNA-binding XRE family transcriptional regulator|nr:helix-turn-helix transcriptional regulator [bacterium]
MKTSVLEREHKGASKLAPSIFDPSWQGTDEDTLFKKNRPDLFGQKKKPSEKHRLARQLFTLRKAAGLSQGQIAKRAGIGSATYQRIEECQPVANPGLDILVKLARAFGVDIQSLFPK